MYKKYLICSSISIFLLGAGLFSASGQTMNASSVDRARNDVRRHARAGTKIVVNLNDGTKLKGYVTQVLDDSFDLTEANTRDFTTIAYRDVGRIKKDGWSKGARIALGLGIGAAVTIAIVAAAVDKGPSGSFCPLGCGPF